MEKNTFNLYFWLVQTFYRTFRPLQGLGSHWPLPLLPSATTSSWAHQVHICAALTNQSFYTQEGTSKNQEKGSSKCSLWLARKDLPIKSCLWIIFHTSQRGKSYPEHYQLSIWFIFILYLNYLGATWETNDLVVAEKDAVPLVSKKSSSVFQNNYGKLLPCSLKMRSDSTAGPALWWSLRLRKTSSETA